VPVIGQLAEVLNVYRSSMGNPATGVMFHYGGEVLWTWTNSPGESSVQSSKLSGWDGTAGKVQAWHRVEFV
jgi:hypothetical protein